VRLNCRAEARRPALLQSSQLCFPEATKCFCPEYIAPKCPVKFYGQYWLALQRNFGRAERFGIGRKIDWAFLEVLELSFTASYLPPDPKIILLGKTITRLDILKFFVQVVWENKLIPEEKFVELSKKLEEIGRMLGGWKKGLLSKIPAKPAGEKQ